MREQQDREYREAEEADRRERERRDKEEREALQREEDERNRKELEEAVELSKKLNYEGDIERRRIELGDEPEGTTDIAMVRFQLPQGSKISRKFYKTDKVQVYILSFTCIHYIHQYSYSFAEASRLFVGPFL